METVIRPLLAVAVLSVPLLAGALALEIANPAGNSEAQSKNVLLLVRTTACHSPEKTELRATAEGSARGVHQSIPLKVIPLSTPGTFGFAREWPSGGTWVVRIVARNPEYKNYATGMLVPVHATSVEWDAVKRYYHEPTDGEVAFLLEGQTARDRASIK